MWAPSANRILAPRAFEAIATPQPVHNPDQTVQAPGAGDRNRMPEGVYVSGLPIRKCPDQVRVDLPHLGNHSVAPGLISSDSPKIPENGLRLKRSFATPTRVDRKETIFRQTNFKICAPDRLTITVTVTLARNSSRAEFWDNKFVKFIHETRYGF